MMITKLKTFCTPSFVSSVLVALIPLLFSCRDYHDMPANQSSMVNSEQESTSTNNQLFIPPLIDTRKEGTTIFLKMQRGQKEFFKGTPSTTFGYNGNYLGPTIKIYNNQDIQLTTINQIGEATSIHKHGLHVPGSVDGGPQQRIEPGESRTDLLKIRQQASTNWYHPHLMGSTAEHVFKGLAGIFIVEDKNSESLSLPNQYGINDIPLIVQDRQFIDNVMTYNNGMGGMHNSGGMNHTIGYMGNTIMVNGTVAAQKSVPPAWVRLRILNGSNARFYNFSFEDKRTFHVIATEGGFLNHPVAVKNLEVWPGERFEVMVDFSNTDRINLNASSSNGSGSLFKVIEFIVDTNIQSDGTLPSQLNEIIPYDLEEAEKTRKFSLQTGRVIGGMMGINGYAMDLSIINEVIPLHQLERWVIRSEDFGNHPFHIHGASFQILSMNGGPVPPHEQGWKDVLKVVEQSEVLIRFSHPADSKAPYVYHCHILEHEDRGMMGQFIVE